MSLARGFLTGARRPATTLRWDALEGLCSGVGTTGGGGLASDLRSIAELRECPTAAFPAVCFFSGRVVERAMNARCLELAPPPESTSRETWPKSEVPGELGAKIDYALARDATLDDMTATAMHQVRRAANAARHLSNESDAIEAAFCLEMLKAALPWICGGHDASLRSLCESAEITELGAEIAHLTGALLLGEATPNAAALARAAPRVLGSFRTHHGGPSELTQWLIQRCIDAHRPDLAAGLIEPFLAGGNADKPAVNVYRPDHTRVTYFNRLIAMRLARTGKPAQAFDFLLAKARQAGYVAGAPPFNFPTHALTPDGAYAYGETLGIMAGACKSLWSSTGERSHLDMARRLYETVYAAQPWNTYHGINRAACAAWCGDMQAARTAGATLLAHLRPPKVMDAQVAFSPWRVLTEAEAALLAGDAGHASATYALAAAEFSRTHAGALARAAAQVRLHALHGAVPAAVAAHVLQALGVPGA
jgi:hypothetical protein